MMKSELSTI